MTAALKPCALCGSVNVRLDRGMIVGTRDNGHRFACCECGARGPWKPQDEAIAAWNTRAVDWRRNLGLCLATAGALTLAAADAFCEGCEAGNDKWASEMRRSEAGQVGHFCNFKKWWPQ